MKKRHYCTICGRKKYEKYMFLIRVFAILKDVWVCNICYNTRRTDTEILKPGVSTAEDKIDIKHIINNNK